MRILDLFCCQGGASAGYAAAGFDVYGVDITDQPNYPFSFHQEDALTYAIRSSYKFDAIHASPPCQAHTKAQRIRGNEHEDLIERTREVLDQTGLPYIIENVVGAPLREDLMLCGSMFGIRTYRHRIFEINGFTVPTPVHPEHTAPVTKMGRPPVDGENMHIVGNFSGIPLARTIMGMPWATRDGLREAIPPAYTEWIGGHLRKSLEGAS